MTKTTRMLLTISLTAFALGCTNVLWGIGAPLGAILFGLFLIFRILEKEIALFDKEEQARIALAETYNCSTEERDEKQPLSIREERVLTPAHS